MMPVRATFGLGVANQTYEIIFWEHLVIVAERDSSAGHWKGG
jgi:hypothetical protein